MKKCLKNLIKKTVTVLETPCSSTQEVTIGVGLHGKADLSFRLDIDTYPWVHSCIGINAQDKDGSTLLHCTCNNRQENGQYNV